MQDKLIETDYYMGADPEKPAILKKDEVACGKLLLCDISVKNIEDEICTVGDISLVYDINGVCQLLGYPVYFQMQRTMSMGYMIIHWCRDSRLTLR